MNKHTYLKDDFAPNINVPVWPWHKRAWHAFAKWFEYSLLPVLALALSLAIIVVLFATLEIAFSC